MRPLEKIERFSLVAQMRIGKRQSHRPHEFARRSTLEIRQYVACFSVLAGDCQAVSEHHHVQRHTFRQRDFYPMLETEPRVLRPANLSDRAPGRGLVTVTAASGDRVAVLNLQGAVFMEAAHSPFAVVDALVAQARNEAA